MRECNIPGCGLRHYARGYCRGHYDKWRNHGDPLKSWPMAECENCGVTYEKKVRKGCSKACQRALAERRRGGGGAAQCAVEGCARPVRSSGLCAGHRRRVDRGVPREELLLPTTSRPWGAILIRDQLGRKECRECREWLDESRFFFASSASDGLMGICKSCTTEQKRLRDYGLSNSDVDLLLEAQNYACAICHIDLLSSGYHIDHDHSCCPRRSKSCGECIRGLLCPACNMGLGHFNDSTESLLEAINYLAPAGAAVLEVRQARRTQTEEGDRV